MRTSGTYQHIDVKLDPALFAPIYTNRSLINFSRKYIDHNLDERVYLFTGEEWMKYHSVNVTEECCYFYLLFFWLLPLTGFLTSADFHTPFRWAKDHAEKNIASRRDLKFVLVKGKEYEEGMSVSSTDIPQRAMTTTVEVTKKRNADGSITEITKTVRQAV